MGHNDEQVTGNPARTLFNLLTLADGAAGDVNAGGLWAELLKVEKPGEFLRRYAAVLNLPGLIQEGINQVPGIKDSLYLKWIPEAERLFRSINLNAKWSQSKDLITATMLSDLQFCDDALSRSSSAECVEEDPLREILTDTCSLCDEVSEAGMDDGLRRYIQRHLYKIVTAIEDYWIVGPDPLRSARASVVADVLYDSGNAVPAFRSEFGKRLWAIMIRISVVLGVYSGAPQLGHDVIQILSPPETQPAGEEAPLPDSDNGHQRAATSVGESSQA